MARYLITGGSGFIGSNLIRKLIKENQELTILIRENSDLWRINDLVPKIQTIKTTKPDVPQNILIRILAIFFSNSKF